MLKTVVNEETEAQRRGTEIHKHFEDRLGLGTPLPPDLVRHEPFMQEIEAIPGEIFCERKVGLNRRLEPVDFFAEDVWWRGVLDVHKRLPDGSAVIVDFKTGRSHNKMRQLHLFMTYCFAEGAPMAEAMFYWTQTGARTRIKMPHFQMGALLRSVVPDLQSYVEAFKTDQWYPKPNGLCANYCGVTGCEHHGRKPSRR